MVALNNNETESRKIDPSRYSEFLKKFKSGKEMITNQPIPDLNFISIPPKSVMIIELMK